MPEDIKEQKEVEQQQEEAEEKKEEVETKLQLTKELAQQTAAFGIYLNLQVTWAAARSLPWGLAAAGAAATRTIVDAGDVKGDPGLTNHTRNIATRACPERTWGLGDTSFNS